MKLYTLARTLPALPMVLLGAACLVFPMIMLMHTALQTPDGVGLDNFVQVFANPVDRAAILNSVQFALWQTLLCVGIGTPIALALLRLSTKSRGWVMSAINVASNFGGPSLAFAFLLLIGANGMLSILWGKIFEPTEFPTLGSMAGLNIIMLYVHLPLYLLLTLPSYALLRDEWREASRMAGAGTWRYWTRVGIPVLTPFVLGNALQVFMWAMGAYGVPYVVTQSPSSVDLLSVQIGLGVQGGIFGLEHPATLAVLLMVQAIALIWLYRTVQRRGEKIL
ncbi:hypothetical protein [Leucobacter denitrificans]|uniref:ABC transmembrane type-1 domain-containing protein n=1 Tax=Leucobacter denitrificans TaxID=683042 RepID=A0A7G9S2M1_9MICO|nr:hypothetical protein [Leucobacter denitrificans]QNN62096.1 hypothetical protein H9L06_07275 [Leucobacter denitrificans]